MPEAVSELAQVRQRLESHYRDMQDIEFTMQNRKLWLLQTRSGKRTAKAMVKIAVDLEDRQVVIREGEIISIDGSTGEVMIGSVPVAPGQLDEDFDTLMTWVDEARHLKVRTNADTPHDAEVARTFGAEGIGLCRTE